MPITPNTYQPLLNTWNVGTIQSITVPNTGTINDIHLITTNKGQYALRASAHNDPKRLNQEHQLITWAHKHNIPAIVPIATRSGNTIVKHNNQHYTLFPFAAGTQVSRDNLQPSHIKTMGHFLAQLHTTLATYPTSKVRKRNLEINIQTDRKKTLSNIDRLIKKITAITSPTPTDKHALHRLTTRREWLHTQTTQQKNTLQTLPFQAIHGDYQETNLFFQNKQISAIIDWDQSYTAPTTWEIARTLHIVLHFQPTPCITFLKAYQQTHPLSLKDLDTTTHAYALSRTHSLWLYEEVYDQANNRVRQFITPGPFRPLIEDWTTLKAQINK